MMRFEATFPTWQLKLRPERPYRSIESLDVPMLAVLAHFNPSQSETLEAIGCAFSAVMAHDGGPLGVFVVTVVVLALLVGLVIWVVRETHREKSEQRAADERHDAAIAKLPSGAPQREWMSVPGHLQLTLQHERRSQRFWYEDCETQSVCGRPVAEEAGAMHPSCVAPKRGA
jgi:hypothetical protein